MDRSNVIYLIQRQYTQNEYGILTPVEVRKKVYCQVDSVTSAEWFEGGRNGLNPEYRFTMFKGDYSGEEIAEYNGNRYSIYRTYIGRNETIELYTEKNKGTSDGETNN